MRILVIAVASVLVAGTGCGAKPRSLEREWKQKTAQDCAVLAELLGELHRDIARVQRAFADEVKKTGPKRALYNPGMFNRLGKMAERLDLSKPRRAERLRRAAWMTHYRFVKGAGALLTRLHRFIALLRQLKASLDLGRSQEQKFGKELEARKPGWIPLAKRKNPAFGVLIIDDKLAWFVGAIKEPVRFTSRNTCKRSTLQAADGLRIVLQNYCHRFTGPPLGGPGCPIVRASIRYLSNQDAALQKTLRCLSMADVLMEGFRFRLLDLELVLAELTKVNVTQLAQQLRQAGGK